MLSENRTTKKSQTSFSVEARPEFSLDCKTVGSLRYSPRPCGSHTLRAGPKVCDGLFSPVLNISQMASMHASTVQKSAVESHSCQREDLSLQAKAADPADVRIPSVRINQNAKNTGHLACRHGDMHMLGYKTHLDHISEFQPAKGVSHA